MTMRDQSNGKTDGKLFEVGLSWLTTKKKGTEAYQLFDDFATWIVNCQ